MHIDWTAFFITLAIIALYFVLMKFKERYAVPTLFYSDLKNIDSTKRGWRANWSRLPFLLLNVSLICFGFAFIDPHMEISKVQEGESGDTPPAPVDFTEGIAIYLLLDQSGSMAEEIRAYSPRGYMALRPKIDMLKDVSIDFVQGNPKSGLLGRPSDLIGLITFARVPLVLVPLTLDHEAIVQKLKQINVIENKDQDGTGVGYAIFKAANLIAATRHYAQDLIKEGKPAYEIKNSVIILVTDGFQDPNQLDYGNGLRTMEPSEAAKFAKENGIRLYIVNVEPDMALEKFGPQRRVLERAAKLTGGEFFLVNSAQGLNRIYADIDKLEKSFLPEQTLQVAPKFYRRLSFYPFLIGLGMAMLMLSIALDVAVLRKVP